MSKMKQEIDRKGLSQLRNVVRRLGLSLYRRYEIMNGRFADFAPKLE